MVGPSGGVVNEGNGQGRQSRVVRLAKALSFMGVDPQLDGAELASKIIERMGTFKQLSEVLVLAAQIAAVAERNADLIELLESQAGDHARTSSQSLEDITGALRTHAAQIKEAQELVADIARNKADLVETTTHVGARLNEIAANASKQMQEAGVEATAMIDGKGQDVARTLADSLAWVAAERDDFLRLLGEERGRVKEQTSALDAITGRAIQLHQEMTATEARINDLLRTADGKARELDEGVTEAENARGRLSDMNEAALATQGSLADHISKGDLLAGQFKGFQAARELVTELKEEVQKLAESVGKNLALFREERETVLKEMRAQLVTLEEGVRQVGEDRAATFEDRKYLEAEMPKLRELVAGLTEAETITREFVATSEKVQRDVDEAIKRSISTAGARYKEAIEPIRKAALHDISTAREGSKNEVNQTGMAAVEGVDTARKQAVGAVSTAREDAVRVLGEQRDAVFHAGEAAGAQITEAKGTALIELDDAKNAGVVAVNDAARGLLATARTDRIDAVQAEVGAVREDLQQMVAEGQTGLSAAVTAAADAIGKVRDSDVGTARDQIAEMQREGVAALGRAYEELSGRLDRRQLDAIGTINTAYTDRQNQAIREAGELLERTRQSMLTMTFDVGGTPMSFEQVIAVAVSVTQQLQARVEAPVAIAPADDDPLMVRIGQFETALGQKADAKDVTDLSGRVDELGKRVVGVEDGKAGKQTVADLDTRVTQAVRTADDALEGVRQFATGALTEVSDLRRSVGEKGELIEALRTGLNDNAALVLEHEEDFTAAFGERAEREDGTMVRAYAEIVRASAETEFTGGVALALLHPIVNDTASEAQKTDAALDGVDALVRDNGKAPVEESIKKLTDQTEVEPGGKTKAQVAAEDLVKQMASDNPDLAEPAVFAETVDNLLRRAQLYSEERLSS